MKNYPIAFTAALLLLLSLQAVHAQPSLQNDYSFVMEIPSVIAMDSSPAHLYILSDTEGMAVFRTQPEDTPQWLYTSTGMEQRGNKVTADIRFAYLFGNSRRLTVLEPTSVLGVYSSTLLPAKPRDAKRINQNLYVALGNKGLGKLSLRTPVSVDSTVELVERARLSRENIMDLETLGTQLFALSSNQMLYKFNYDQELSLTKEFQLSAPLDNIYLINNTLYGSDKDGAIYEIDREGRLSQLGSIGEPVIKVAAWQDWLIIKGRSNRLWTSYRNRSPELWKKDRAAKNFFTVTKGNLWLCEYNKVSRIISVDEPGTAPSRPDTEKEWSGEVSLKPIPDQTIPHTKPLLIPLRLSGSTAGDIVQFSYQSGDIEDAEIRGQSFYWEPTANDVGTHRVQIVAKSSSGQTDSIQFTVTVSSFNAPPRFAPIRPIRIPLGEEFTLPIKASDPDGTNKSLVRYIGVDLPNNASIDEKSGVFSWKPSIRQVGKNKFRVIATDQFGAASSINVTITVTENVQRLNSN